VAAVKKLTELVATAAAPTDYSASAKAQRLKSVVFRTTFPPALLKRPQHLALAIDRTNATTWTVTVTDHGKRAKATVTSADGKPMTIVDAGFTCQVQPLPSFCPAHQAGGTASHMHAEFTTKSTVVVSALIGPLTTTPRLAHPVSVAVPTYTVRQLVADLPLPAPGKKTPASTYAANATVSPGDHLAIAQVLTGTSVGAPQAMTVSIPQGPAKSLTIIASVPGGTAIKSKVSSADGKPIELVTPQFHCYLPPMPSPCPPSAIKLGGRHYTFTFQASPLSPVRLVTAVQAG
jgi:hypothetical protein